MRAGGMWKLLAVIVLTGGTAASVVAQEPEATTREATIEHEQAEKVPTLHPYTPGRGEALISRAEDILVNGVPRWHPFFSSAYFGGGFTLGVGYAHHVSAYNWFDVRGSYTIRNYKRVEGEFIVPRLFHRRGSLSVLGGWREATQVAFYGLGIDSSKDDRTNYDFQQPYGSAILTFWPTRRALMLRGGLELSQWSLGPGEGTYPSVDTVYTPQTLPGLGAKTTYLHSEGTVGFDWRPSPGYSRSSGYSRRGGFYGISLHDYNDRDEEFGFRQVNYEAIQHVPILREAWVISLHGLAQTAYHKSGQQVPFFMLPYLGSGHTLRGFVSHRFRDENSLLLQAEWRIMANRFMETAFFYDAGKVAPRRQDLDFNGLKSDYGFGVRFHGPFATPLRVEVAKSSEGLTLVLATTPIF